MLEITIKILKVTIEEFVQRLKAVKLALKVQAAQLIDPKLVTVRSNFKFTFATQLFEHFINFKNPRPELVTIRSKFVFTFAPQLFIHFINFKNPRPELVTIRSKFIFTFALQLFIHFINLKNQ